MSSSVGKLQPPVVAFTESKGEIIGSGNYSVLVLDKREVHLYSVNDFKKKAVWVYPYPTVQIVCVQDLNNSLLISLAKNTGSSIVYEIQVYSLETFRQLAVVSAPHEVTSIAPVVVRATLMSCINKFSEFSTVQESSLFWMSRRICLFDRFNI